MDFIIVYMYSTYSIYIFSHKFKDSSVGKPTMYGLQAGYWFPFPAGARNSSLVHNVQTYTGPIQRPVHSAGAK
jgi:hypothetical protein